MPKLSALLLSALLFPAVAYAVTIPENDGLPSFKIFMRNSEFHPLELEVPANQRFKISVKNRDSNETIAFDCPDVGHTGLLDPGDEETIRIKPLAPGTYECEDAFNEFLKAFITAK